MKNKTTKPKRKLTSQPQVGSSEWLDALYEELRAEAKSNWKRASDMSGPQECLTVSILLDSICDALMRTRKRI
jgi:hypothetical protein